MNTQERLAYAQLAIPVLRTLKTQDATMRYGDFARAIGLLGENERWPGNSMGKQIGSILYLLSAISDQTGEKFDFHRFVGPNGKPGAGLYAVSRIVTRRRKVSTPRRDRRSENKGTATC